MTRVCMGYKGYTCDVSLEGRTARAKRCPSCSRKANGIRSNEAAKRKALEIKAKKAREFDDRELYPAPVKAGKS